MGSRRKTSAQFGSRNRDATRQWIQIRLIKHVLRSLLIAYKKCSLDGYGSYYIYDTMTWPGIFMIWTMTCCIYLGIKENYLRRTQMIIKVNSPCIISDSNLLFLIKITLPM